MSCSAIAHIVSYNPRLARGWCLGTRLLHASIPLSSTQLAPAPRELTSSYFFCTQPSSCGSFAHAAKHCVEMSASELLQMHKAELRQKSLQKKTTPKMTKKPLTEKSTKNDSSIGDLFTPDCTLPLREEHMRVDSGGGEKDTTAHAGYHGNSTKEKIPEMSDMKTGDSDQTSETSSGSQVSLKISAQEKNVSKLNTSRRSLPSLRVLERQGAGCSLDNPSSPLLGRGMTCGATIELTSPTNSKPSRAKVPRFFLCS